MTKSPSFENLGLRDCFTNDAWSLISSFFLELQKKMQEAAVPTGLQASLLEGLNEFIVEFTEDASSPDKVNYQRALILLQEMGSPTEIILTLDGSKWREPTPSETTISTERFSRTCTKCRQPNPNDAFYCENCGYSLYAQRSSKATVSQIIIDHPYTFSFLALYGTLALLAWIWGEQTAPHTTLASHIAPLGTALFVAFFPAIFLALLFGWVADLFLTDQKSFTYRYNKILNHFEDSFVLGFVMVFFACFFLSIAGGSGFYVYILLGIGVLLSAFVYAPITLIAKPQGLPYVTLLRAKQRLDNYALKKLRIRNFYPGSILFVFTFLWGMVLAPVFTPNLAFEGKLFFTFLLLLALGLGYNGGLVMYYYSWPMVTRFIQEHDL
ncbi:MAG: hypothetical protein ACFFFG_07335 [Candidatus Thorarchaeota archaeon]